MIPVMILKRMHKLIISIDIYKLIEMSNITAVPWQALEKMFYDNPETECTDHRVSDHFIYDNDTELYKCMICYVTLKSMDDVMKHSIDKKHTVLSRFLDPRPDDDDTDIETLSECCMLDTLSLIDRNCDEQDAQICLSCGA
jgi:hypothetical protein